MQIAHTCCPLRDKITCCHHQALIRIIKTHVLTQMRNASSCPSMDCNTTRGGAESDRDNRICNLLSAIAITTSDKDRNKMSKYPVCNTSTSWSQTMLIDGTDH